jgi:hypothetical protein
LQSFHTFSLGHGFLFGRCLRRRFGVIVVGIIGIKEARAVIIAVIIRIYKKWI